MDIPTHTYLVLVSIVFVVHHEPQDAPSSSGSHTNRIFPKDRTDFQLLPNTSWDWHIQQHISNMPMQCLGLELKQKRLLEQLAHVYGILPPVYHFQRSLQSDTRSSAPKASLRHPMAELY